MFIEHELMKLKARYEATRPKKIADLELDADDPLDRLTATFSDKFDEMASAKLIEPVILVTDWESSWSNWPMRSTYYSFDTKTGKAGEMMSRSASRAKLKIKGKPRAEHGVVQGRAKVNGAQWKRDAR